MTRTLTLPDLRRKLLSSVLESQGALHLSGDESWNLKGSGSDRHTRHIPAGNKMENVALKAQVGHHGAEVPTEGWPGMIRMLGPASPWRKWNFSAENCHSHILVSKNTLSGQQRTWTRVRGQWERKQEAQAGDMETTWKSTAEITGCSDGQYLLI